MARRGAARYGAVWRGEARNDLFIRSGEVRLAAAGLGWVRCGREGVIYEVWCGSERVWRGGVRSGAAGQGMIYKCGLVWCGNAWLGKVWSGKVR